jgi:hypothetical protein
MDILPPSEEALAYHVEFQAPQRTPAATVEKLRYLCTENDLKGFKEMTDAVTSRSNHDAFAIAELCDTMIEAITHDRAEFVLILLSYGFPIQPSYTLEAIRRKAKGTLGCFI